MLSWSMQYLSIHTTGSRPLWLALKAARHCWSCCHLS